jgi:hypothetical protein
VIVLGASIGSGEFLLGPAAFVKHGLSLLWVAGVAILLQTIFNTELMRYTLATGEPVFAGFMRTGPSPVAWAWLYAGFYFLQIGWPAWAATAAGALFFLATGRLAGPEHGETLYWIGVGTFALCVALLLVGRRIERTLELLNWAMVTATLGGFLVLAGLFVPAHTWLAALAGAAGFDAAQGAWDPLPRGSDLFLIAALAAYSGAGGVGNLTLSSWARDKGYGMSQHAGYIASAAGERVALAHSGFVFDPDAAALERWRGWWRIVRADQWGVFFCGALLGMGLPALLYITFLPSGAEIRGLGIAAALAQAVSTRAGTWVGGTVALLAVWLLFKTQFDLVEALARAVTDILWTGSRRLRAWRGGDVRAVYYGTLAAVVVWGVVALRLAQPIVLLQISANIAGVVMVVASLHLLYVNTRLLPPPLRPPGWRRAALVAMALFYGGFAALSLSAAV